MITKNRFIATVLVATLFYFFLYWLLNDVFLYVIGGGIGAFLKLFSMQAPVSMLIFLWIVLLGIATLFYCKFNSSPIKYLFLLLVAVLLYVVDFIGMGIMKYDSSTRIIIFFYEAAMVLIKGLVLSLIIYFADSPT